MALINQNTASSFSSIDLIDPCKNCNRSSRVRIRMMKTNSKNLKDVTSLTYGCQIPVTAPTIGVHLQDFQVYWVQIW